MKVKLKYIIFITIISILSYFMYHKFYQKKTMSIGIESIDQCSYRFNRDRIYEYNNLLTKDECNTIIELAKPILEKSKVMSDKEYEPGRTSTNVFLKSNIDNVLKKIDDIVYSHLKIPIKNYEDLQVVNYKSTQKYDAHYDACDINDEICQEDIKNRGGLRYATFIFYLNDDFTGGKTDFPIHKYKAKPMTGKGVLFFNLNDDNTDRRENSFHAGLPPIKGEKWLANKWIRLYEHH